MCLCLCDQPTVDIETRLAKRQVRIGAHSETLGASSLSIPMDHLCLTSGERAAAMAVADRGLIASALVPIDLVLLLASLRLRPNQLCCLSIEESLPLAIVLLQPANQPASQPRERKVSAQKLAKVAARLLGDRPSNQVGS